MFFDMDSVDIITLLQVLRQELMTMEGLHNLDIPNSKMSKFLSLDFESNVQSTSSMMGPAKTTDFAIDIRDTGIMWINDIENDAQYKRWSSNYMELLRPTFPGMLRNVKRNLYNLVR